jgi:hypothetical protein
MLCVGCVLDILVRLRQRTWLPWSLRAQASWRQWTHTEEQVNARLPRCTETRHTHIPVWWVLQTELVFQMLGVITKNKTVLNGIIHSVLKTESGFIYICNTNKCTCKSIYNLYCFLFAPTCFSYTLTIFKAYILVSRVHVKMCSSPYNFCVKTS